MLYSLRWHKAWVLCYTPYAGIKRLAFAKEHDDCDLEHWKQVIWRDKSPSVLQNSSSQFVSRTNDEKKIRSLNARHT